MLTSEQIMFVGLLASAVTFLLKLLFDWFGWQPGRGILTVVLYAVAFVLAGIWSGIYVPAYVDPVQFVADLLAMIAPVVGIATLIYNILYEKVFAPIEARVLRAASLK